MVYKKFRINCTLRVILLSVTICLFLYLLFKTTLYATIAIMGSVALYQIYALIHYVEKTNRDLNRFLQSIKHEDFSQTFSSQNLGPSFDELKETFNDVTDKFRRARAEKEEHFRYLQTIVQHIGIGLIAFQQNGYVELINTAAKRLLKVLQLKNIRTLESFSKTLVDTLLKMKAGDKTLVKVEDNNELLQLAVYATEFKLQNQKITLVSIQNIHSELEEKEMEAWQNLIRVLTHEIMNSVTPIASLASTVNGILEDVSSKEKLSEEIISDVSGAVQTIQKRSQGLLHFVDAYRKLTRIPRPNFQIFPISELFTRVDQLMRPQIIEKGIHNCHINVDPVTLELTADPELIEQVLINLIMNAIQAVEGRTHGKIELLARMDDKGRTIIQVFDNGCGIIPEVQDKIFIPFFTTKKSGTGIGLSLARQIMRLHRGAITVQSIPDEKTVFTLRF